MLEGDIAIVGAGAAGLSLAHALALPAGPGPVPSLILVEPPPGRRPPPRTWCFWEAGDGPYEQAVAASWRWLRVHDRRGRATVRDIAPLGYKMIRSPDFEALVGARLDGVPGVRRLDGVVDRVRPAAWGAEALLTAAGGARQAVGARWLYDSRPLPRLPAARTTLLQHFHGWFVRTRRPVFDPRVADWMDFRTPQPDHGMAFGYVLPTGRHEALVEYTQFSAAPLPHRAYQAALRHYTQDVLRLGALDVTATETGAIPMTDARFPRRSGPAVFRIGTAGGATRPATGYTFAAIQRQSRAIARAHRLGGGPLPPRPHPARAAVMDAVLLHGLDSGGIDGADFFPRLFRQVPAERLLRFLDGETALREDLAIGLRTPMFSMLRSAAALPTLPRRRPPPAAAPPAVPGPAADPTGRTVEPEPPAEPGLGRGPAADPASRTVEPAADRGPAADPTGRTVEPEPVAEPGLGRGPAADPASRTVEPAADRGPAADPTGRTVEPEPVAEPGLGRGPAADPASRTVEPAAVPDPTAAPPAVPGPAADPPGRTVEPAVDRDPAADPTGRTVEPEPAAEPGLGRGPAADPASRTVEPAADRDPAADPADDPHPPPHHPDPDPRPAPPRAEGVM